MDKKNTRTSSLQVILFAVATASAAIGANATTYKTDSFQGGGTSSALLGVGAALYCNSTGCVTTAPSNMSGYATITAWSTPTAQSSTTTSPTDTGAWVQAQLAIYSGGIGISNTVQGGTAENFSTAPQHAIDNTGADDILVVDFGSTGWDVNSFSLGWVCNFIAGGTTCASGGKVGVEAWLGNTFASESFNLNNNLTAVPSGGYTRLTLASNDPAAVGMVPDSSAASVTGRYLIITGDLGAGTINGTSVNGYGSAFKVNQVVATRVVPIPGSLPLIGLGLLALAFARRRCVPANSSQ